MQEFDVPPRRLNPPRIRVNQKGKPSPVRPLEFDVQAGATADGKVGPRWEKTAIVVGVPAGCRSPTFGCRGKVSEALPKSSVIPNSFLTRISILPSQPPASILAITSVGAILPSRPPPGSQQRGPLSLLGYERTRRCVSSAISHSPLRPPSFQRLVCFPPPRAIRSARAA